MEMTYEQRLQEYAQMHADDFNKRYNVGLVLTDTDCVEAAGVTIAAVADAILEAFGPNSEIGKEYLIEKGYVPKPDPSGPYAMGPGM